MNPLTDTVYEVQEAAVMTGQAFRRSVSSPYYLRDITIQMDQIGFGSLLIIILTGLFTGGILALQTSKVLTTFGAQSQTGLLHPAIWSRAGQPATRIGRSRQAGAG